MRAKLALIIAGLLPYPVEKNALEQSLSFGN
jgi:hypothetical protein